MGQSLLSGTAQNCALGGDGSPKAVGRVFRPRLVLRRDSFETLLAHVPIAPCPHRTLKNAVNRNRLSRTKEEFQMRSYLISIPILIVTVIGFSILWFFGLLNRREPNDFPFVFYRVCSGYDQHPKMTLYWHGSREPRFRFMLHEVDETGNRVMNKETCSRLSMELPTGSSSVSYMVASQDNQVVEVPVKDFSGQKITVRSVASNIHCVLPVVCVSSQNILGVSGSLSSFPSRISSRGMGGLFFRARKRQFSGI